jgi:hypothetical protein
LLKVLRTVGEEVGMFSDSDKAVVDLPKVMGRVLVWRESLGLRCVVMGPGIAGLTMESMVDGAEVGG